MNKGIWQDFDGYGEIAAEIEAGKKYGPAFDAQLDEPRAFIDRMHPSRLRLRVSEIIDETPSAKTLRLVSPEGWLPPFRAGQYIALSVEIGGVRTGRPYSLSSPPNQIGHWDVTVRRVDHGLVSNYLLDEVTVGRELESSGPGGHFYYNPLFHDRTMVCLAGGSGITPFMSMVREVAERDLDRTIYLFYGNRALDEAIFHDALESVASRHANVRYHPVVENPPDGYDGLTGLMTAESIGSVIGDAAGKTFYLCGPQAMYDFCVPELRTLGAPARKIRRELYGVPLEITKQPGWPEGVRAGDEFAVTVNGGRPFKTRAGETLLSALEKNGVVVPSLCRSGECSMCRVKLNQGKVYQPAGALVRRSDRKYGYVHSCASYPLEDLDITI